MTPKILQDIWCLGAELFM